MPVPKPNRWHPVMLPDDYLRKMKQDLSELEAQVESKTRYEPVSDDPPPDDDQRRRPAGLTSQPELVRFG